MKPQNKNLLPKPNKYTHKEILDLTGPVNRTRSVPVSPRVLMVSISLLLLGFVGFIIPGVNPLTMSLVAKGVVNKYG